MVNSMLLSWTFGQSDLVKRVIFAVTGHGHPKFGWKGPNGYKKFTKALINHTECIEHLSQEIASIW